MSMVISKVLRFVSKEKEGYQLKLTDFGELHSQLSKKKMSKYVSSILTKKVKPRTTSFEAPEVFVCIEKTKQDEGMK